LGEVLRALGKEGVDLNATAVYCSNKKNNFQFQCTIEDANQYLLPLTELNGELELECLDPNYAKPKRVKERNIKEIVNKVAEWRKLYIGKADANGTVKKYTLEEAAEKVGIAKKTLDDYLLQIRAGKKYGFDFNKHSEGKVGVLRSFVREHKDKHKYNIDE